MALSPGQPRPEPDKLAYDAHEENRSKKGENMPVKNPRELFVQMLSHVRQGTERTATILKELGEAAQNEEIKKTLQARAFVSEKTIEKLDEAFRLLGEHPVKLTGHLHDVFLEDFRKELAEIQSPEARRLFVLAKANHLMHQSFGCHQIATTVLLKGKDLMPWSQHGDSAAKRIMAASE